MRFLYVAPRYHTNQIPIMKGLIQNGHEVLFLSHYAGKIEDYSYVSPVIVGYAPLFRLIDYIYVHFIKKDDPKAADKKLKCGFPPVFRLAGYMKRFKPDVVILRERSVYSIFAYFVCCIYKYPAILYNQSPLWEDRIKNDLPHRMIRKITPKVRMTPVMGTLGEGKVKEPGAFFVPFVMEPQVSPEQKQYCEDGKVRIFSVGKYEKRKNHQMIIEVIEELSEHYPLHLTIAGECSTPSHRKYYEQAEDYVREHKLKEQITLCTNLNRERIHEEYTRADLFIIPSTLEPASISQLEAMAFSLPVICSDTNGTACYVEEGITGYLFQDNQKEDLKQVVLTMFQEWDTMRRMGAAGYQAVKDKYTITEYVNGIIASLIQLPKV